MDKLLSVKDEILQLNYRTVLHLINADFIHSIRIGRTHRIAESELEKFMSSAEKESIIYQL